MARAKKKADEPGVVDAKNVLDAMRRVGKPMTGRDLLKALKLHKQYKNAMFAVMDELARQGKVIVTRGNAYGLTEQMHMVTGKLEIQRSGVGYVIPEDPKRKADIFVPPQDFGEAWHGDRVVVAVSRERQGKNPAGRIVRVIERRLEEIPCRTDRALGQGYMLCQPTDPRQHMLFMVPFANDAMPAPGIIVHVTPGERLDRELWAGKAAAVLGEETDVAVQEAMVKHNHSIPMKFPRACVEEALALPAEPSETDMQGRKDMRGVDFVTIDGATARDFDDAVFVARRGRGFTLWVAIADVSHYVRLGSPLDVEARERANSYYFPRSVEPMFPKELSNGLCSLNPDVPRLAMVAEMDFSAQGKPGKTSFYPAVIKSKARLTYSQVKRAVIDGDEEERAAIAHVMPMLLRAYELAKIMNAKRKARGSLDFDLPEPEIMFNLTGETVDIRPKVRHFGHQIIEEFMIAANEAVAEFLESAGSGLLFRIHEEPDPEKIRSLYKMLAHTEMAARIPEETTPQALQALLQTAQGTDAEFMVNRLTLRTMMQAKYSPDNVGHFGLASECYCHFTSPIRRYADLQVHRALRHALSLPSGAAMPSKKLKDLGTHLSARERTAMEAERETLKRVTVLFLRDKVGREFSGVISGLADFGFWVELSEVMAEGMVRVSLLTDDYYVFHPERQMLLGERTGRMFRLGQSLGVLLQEVNLARLEVTLVPVDQAPKWGEGGEEGEPPAAPERKPRGVKVSDGAMGSGGKPRGPAKGRSRDDAGRRPGKGKGGKPRRAGR